MQDMLPDYIHMHVAESILFAGKAVRVLRNPSSKLSPQESSINQPMLRGPSRAQGFIGSLGPQKELFNGATFIAEDLLPQSEADKIEAMIKELKVPNFCKSVYCSYIINLKFLETMF